LATGCDFFATGAGSAVALGPNFPGQAIARLRSGTAHVFYAGCCSGTNWSAKSFLGNRWSRQASSFILLQKEARQVEVAIALAIVTLPASTQTTASRGSRPSHHAERAKLRCRDFR